MADTAVFVVKLKDLYTKQAKSASAATAALRSQVSAASKAVSQFGRGPLRAMSKQGNGAARALRVFQRGGLKMGITHVFRKLGGLGGILNKAIPVVARFGLHVARTLFNAAKWAVASTGIAAVTVSILAMNRAMKTERVTSMLDRLQETKGRGGQAFREIAEMAARLGLDTDNANESVAGFLKQGFTFKKAKQFLRLGADMQAMGNSAEDVKGVFLAMRQIASAGRLQGDELNQLAERGVSSKFVYEEIGKLLGKSVKEVQKLKEAGKVGSDVALQAIENATKRVLGTKVAGEAAKDFVANTMTGAIAAAKSRAKNFWITLTEKAAPGIKAGITKALGFLEDFARSEKGIAIWAKLSMFMDQLGKSLKVLLPVLVEAGGALFGGFMTGLMGANAEGRTMSETAAGIAASIKQALPTIESMGQKLGQLVNKILELTKRTAPLVGLLLQVADIVLPGGSSTLERQGGRSVRASTRAGNSTATTLGESEAANARRSVRARVRGRSVGRNIGQGMVEGMRSTIPAIAEAGDTMGGHAIRSVRKRTRTHSPSREMMDVGQDVGDGFMIGLDRSMPDQIAPAIGRSADAAFGAASNRGGSVVHVEAPITINGAGEPGAVAAAVQAAFESNLSSTLSRYANEVGA